MVATPFNPAAARTNFKTDIEGTYSQQNVGDNEKLLSLIGGGALAIYGLTRGSVGGMLLAALGGSLVYRGLTGHCHLYGALGIDTSGHGSATAVKADHGVKVEESIVIDRPAAELYRYWMNLENLPHVMSNLEKVERQGDGKSHWVAKAPLGMTVSWDAEIYTQRENELISWRSLPGSIIDTAGSVHFEKMPNGEGTRLTVSLKYDPPAGKAGATLARWLGKEPSVQVREDLQKFKQQMESTGNPAGVTKRI